MAGIPTELMYSTKPFVQRRAELEQRFRDLSEVILSTGVANSEQSTSEDYFPTLQVGYMARAMGLNLSSSQVVQLVELVEDNEPSRGAVSRARLAGVIIDTLLTGLLGGPTLVSERVLPSEKLISPPSCCQRDSEKRIYQAFATLDTAKNGYLTPEVLRAALTSMGEQMSADEVDSMLLASVDPEAEVVYYKDLAEVLASS